MAIDDVSFTNLRGEVISRSNLVQQMIDYYDLKVNSGETRVTDFNEGSEIRNLLESIAVDIYYLMEMENDILKQCFVDTATGVWLDKIGMHPFINLERNTGVSSKGKVTFSIPSALTSTVVIPANTILLCSENSLYYSTDLEGVIEIGDISVDVPASCVTVGRDGDCQSNTITTIVDAYFENHTVSVTNADAFTDGVDYEEDEQYRERLLDYVRQDDFGSLGYYKRLCEDLESVHDVVLVDDSIYTKKVLVNGKIKPTTDSCLLDVLTVLSDLNNTVIGHTFTVDKPTYDTIDLDITVTVNNEMDENIIKNIVKDFFDGGDSVLSFEYPGLNINQSVTEQALYGIFNDIENIQEVSIESDGSPVTDISCDEGHCLKAGTVTVVQDVIE